MKLSFLSHTADDHISVDCGDEWDGRVYFDACLTVDMTLDSFLVKFVGFFLMFNLPTH